ncbi:Pentatricopeptide (PPR) repeat-containing protein-like [Quillaja saponaria]|uniref:Pentatricopeptide (PPR) repeat-containing protein-like n=1 Tax=Quillaja saponaria TaxID=32244 RepID=A0AAD7P7C7_QUISA|nr:Pentatricopeptide (PPR) repeat-containing protein-like [Quillaja saponaria]
MLQHHHSLLTSRTSRHGETRPDSELQKTLSLDRGSDIVCRREKLISGPGRLTPSSPTMQKSDSLRLTKLLLNVTIERSVGPVQVVMSPENSVYDLVKAVLEIYVRERRRPLFKETDPTRFGLHYSQFSLESLKPEEKLMELGSRNFFLCSKPSSSSSSSCLKEAKLTIDSALTLMVLVHLVL